MADVDAGDRILCHACGRVWPQSQHGLDCPYCGSDFTEIIEIPPDTDTPHPDPPVSVPGGHRSPSPPPNPWAGHNPWAGLDHDEPHGWDTTPGYGFTQRSFRSPNGRFQFSSATITHAFPPRRAAGTQREIPIDPIMRTIDSFLQTMNEAGRIQGGPQGPGSPRRTFQTSFDYEVPLDGNRGHEHHRPAGLFPRDADGPQPMGNPLGNLGDILDMFRANMEAGGATDGPGVRIMTTPVPLPLALISALLNIERNGDAVYSQEELDRVISQLVEQAGNHSAAPPASQDAIRSLPKKPADQEMLGAEGKAECSICMDTVKVGDEVTVLPCTHWFHGQCIEMWLGQHNTCPHCRRGIPSNTAPDSTHAASEGTSDQNGASSSRQPSSEEERPSHSRQSSRSEGAGGWAGWVRSRLSGGS